jgi:hypothetical protein
MGCDRNSHVAIACPRYPIMGMIIVGVIATVLVCIQNFGASLGVGWGLVHGAGPAAFMALVPLALGLAVIWEGLFYVVRRDWRYKPALFALYAVSILMLNEAWLPSTPLHAWRSRRAMEAVQVTNLRDEVARSSRGIPIGIQVTYEARFPVDAVSSLHMTGLGRIDGDPHPALRFERGYYQTVTPAPESASGFYRFRRQTTYAVTEINVPNFLSYDPRTGAACIRDVLRPGLTEGDFLDALSRSTRVRYRTTIRLYGPDVSDPVVLNEYDTQREYDLQDLYRRNRDEGAERCDR